MKKPSEAELACVPETVRTFMDRMMTPLDKIARQQKFELRAYDYLEPKATYWLHNLYSTCYGWAVTAQIYVNLALAKENTASIRIYVRFKPFEGWIWTELTQESVCGLEEIFSRIQQLIIQLHRTCGLMLQRVDAPNALA